MHPGTIISEEALSRDLRTAMLLPIGGTRENGSHKGSARTRATRCYSARSFAHIYTYVVISDTRKDEAGRSVPTSSRSGMAAVNELMTHGLSSTGGHFVPPVDSPDRWGSAALSLRITARPLCAAVSARGLKD